MWMSSRFGLLASEASVYIVRNRIVFVSINEAPLNIGLGKETEVRIILLLVTIFFIADLIADTAIAQQTQMPQTAGYEIPLRGMSKEDVSEKFGQPISTSKTVGEPPISIWHYNQFSVYFETNTVLHSVQIIAL
jgi:hypothetical protein